MPILLRIAIEVPSGYLADCLGRKLVLIAGSGVIALACGLYGLANSFSGFLVGELLIAIGAALISGADESLLYDSLLIERREGEFSFIWSRIRALEIRMGAVGFGVGSLLVMADERLPWFASAIVFCAHLIVATRMHEPTRSRTSSEIGHFRTLLIIGREQILSQTSVRRLLVCSAIVISLTQLGFWLAQPYFKQCGFDKAWNGLLLAGLGFAGGIFASKAHHFRSKMGVEGLANLTLPVIALSYVLLANVFTLWGPGLLLLHQFVRGLHSVLFSAYLHRMVGSEFRTTVISLNSSLSQLCAGVLFVVAGASLRMVDLSTLFSALAIFATIATVATRLAWRK